MRKLWCAALILLLPVAALAQVEKPPEITPYIHASAPLGEGVLSRLFIKVYDASLWSDAPSWSMGSTFALSLHYRLHFTTEDLVKSTLQEMQRFHPLNDAQVTDYTKQLTAVYPTVKKGDVITALYIPNKGTAFFYNGKPDGHIAGDAFAEQFFSIWLAPTTSDPALRKALLGQHSG